MADAEALIFYTKAVTAALCCQLLPRCAVSCCCTVLSTAAMLCGCPHAALCSYPSCPPHTYLAMQCISLPLFARMHGVLFLCRKRVWC